MTAKKGITGWKQILGSSCHAMIDIKIIFDKSSKRMLFFLWLDYALKGMKETDVKFLKVKNNKWMRTMPKFCVIKFPLTLELELCRAQVSGCICNRCIDQTESTPVTCNIIYHQNGSHRVIAILVKLKRHSPFMFHVCTFNPTYILHILK